MSPVSLRRYRAERLLRREFEALQSRVLKTVGARLRAARVELDNSDLEAAYALAWQGLYAAVLDGELIDSPVAWLTLVTFRRAVEQYRSQIRLRGAGEVDLARAAGLESHAGDADLEGGLDTRDRLGQLLEGLAGRLDERERQAAALCYLQGLSRAEAAMQLGISEGRMRKLMEGRGAGDPGVSGKVGALARMIDEGSWCEDQGSLMRALAYGILDRDGDRYRLALMHHRRCPSCRAYVVSLRGLAVALPPTLLPGARLALAGLAGGGAGAGASGTAGASGAGASGAGGGLALAGGPLGAKFAVGCLVAVGVGAGCIGLQSTHGPGPRPAERHLAHTSAGVMHRVAPAPRRSLVRRSQTRVEHAAASPAGRPAVAAVHEFGLEPGASPGRPSPVPVKQRHFSPSAPRAHAAAREFGPG